MTLGSPKKNIFFHRLVAAAFHAEQARAMLANGVSVTELQVDHIDEDSTNPRADNLQWVTRTENLQYKSRTRKRRRVDDIID